MNKLYRGIIVQESLEDTSVLSHFTILEETKPRDQNDWHLYIEGDYDALIELSKVLKPTKWYVHFWCENEMILVFKDKLFYQEVDDQATWKEAITYGLSIGIPKEQLNFLLEE